MAAGETGVGWTGGSIKVELRGLTGKTGFHSTQGLA